MDISAYISADGKLKVGDVILELWKKRALSAEVPKLTKILTLVVDEKECYRQIELFLPQLSHMTIHAPSETFSFFEELLCSISKFSMYSAFILTYSMIAACEDFQPEDPSEQPNTSSDVFLFRRCARLLQNIEKSTVDRALPPHLNDAEKIFSSKSGWILYKRLMRRSSFSGKGWKRRYFVAHAGVLLCYSDDSCSTLKRAMSLTDCIVQVIHSVKHEHCFEVISRTTGAKYQLRTENEASTLSWISILNRESDQRGEEPPSEQGELSSLEHNTQSRTEEKQKRLDFFRGQLRLVRSFTDIAESLRFIERPNRKDRLQEMMSQLSIPSLSFLPLTSGLDTWCQIIRPFPRECHAFQTKARCPSLMLFECEKMQSIKQTCCTLPQNSTISVVEFLALDLTKNYSDYVSKDIPRTEDGNASFFLSTPGCCREQMWVSLSSSSSRLADNGFFNQGSLVESSSDRSDADKGLQMHSLHKKSELWGETIQEKIFRLRSASTNGSEVQNWELRGIIAKSNDDVRQEAFVMQMIKIMKEIFHEENVPVWLHTYNILSTSKSRGLIELIPNSFSLDALKKKSNWPGTLNNFFIQYFCAEESDIDINTARMNYVSSMAGYSIVCYLLAIKDRHNGNIMIDNQGHIIHIDFGFVLGLAPGKQFSLETAPWKLNLELLEVMGSGNDDSLVSRYKELCTLALAAVRKHSTTLLGLMHLMSYKSNFPSFQYNADALKDFENRLLLNVPDIQLPSEVEKMFIKSTMNSGTFYYDQFQLYTNGIAV